MYNTMRYIQLKIATTNQNHLHRKKITIAVQILNEKKSLTFIKLERKRKIRGRKKGNNTAKTLYIYYDRGSVSGQQSHARKSENFPTGKIGENSPARFPRDAENNSRIRKVYSIKYESISNKYPEPVRAVSYYIFMILRLEICVDIKRRETKIKYRCFRAYTENSLWNQNIFKEREYVTF